MMGREALRPAIFAALHHFRAQTHRDEAPNALRAVLPGQTPLARFLLIPYGRINGDPHTFLSWSNGGLARTTASAQPGFSNQAVRTPFCF
jgi:hypothetical protein